MQRDRIPPARILAPAALVAAFLALIIIIAGSGGDDGGGKHKRAGNGAAQTSTAKKHEKKTYVVKSGDSLTIIAERTGVPVEQLLQANPDVDPQALIAGECIALRDASDCK
jgi:LysM repeat protein